MDAATADDARRRTVTWKDPAQTAQWAGKISGKEFFEKLQSGELPPPPVVELLGMSLDEVGEGRAVFALEPSECHYNPIGVVHGGVIATMLDSAVGCAIHTTLPEGVAYTTLEIKINYLRATTVKTGRIRAEGQVIHVGRKSAVAEGKVFDAHNKLIATCSTTCILMQVDRT